MPIGRNFHIIHMTDDLAGLDAWYDDVFSALRFMDRGYMEAEKRDASLVLVGNLCLEPLAPAFRVEGWERMPLGRFYERFGRSWHSLAFYAEPPETFPELYEGFRDRGLRLYGKGGVFPHNGSTEEHGALFIHPQDATTLLEFWPAPLPGGPLRDPRLLPGFNPAWWTERHPLQIRQTSHVTLAVQDLEKARDFYVDALGGTLLGDEDVKLSGTRSVYVAVGTDIVVELAEPLDADSLIGQYAEKHSEGLFSVTFKVRDLDRAEAYLGTKGITAAARDDATLLTDPATTHGVVMGFTSRDLPNDRRPDWAP